MAEFLYGLPEVRLDDPTIHERRYPAHLVSTTYPESPHWPVGSVFAVLYRCIARTYIKTRKTEYHCSRETTFPDGSVLRDAWVQATLPNEGRQPEMTYAVTLI